MQETWVQSLGQKDPWRRRWQATPVFLPEKSHGQEPGYSLWDRKESDRTEHAKKQDLVFKIQGWQEWDWPWKVKWGPEEAGLLCLYVSWRELEPAPRLLPIGSQRDLSCLSFLKTLGPQSSNRRKVKLVFRSYCLLGKGAMPWVSTYPHPPTIWFV